MTHFRTRKQRTRGTSSSVHAAEQKPIFSVPKERRRSTVQMGSATPLSQLLTPVNTSGVMSAKSGAPRAAFYFYVSFYPPSQKTTAVRLWMNARGGPSEVQRSGTKEDASADFAEEMKDATGVSPWRLHFSPQHTPALPRVVISTSNVD